LARFTFTALMPNGHLVRRSETQGFLPALALRRAHKADTVEQVAIE
jgi:hypothetical protein